MAGILRWYEVIGAIVLSVMIGFGVGDSGRWFMDRVNAQVGGWAHPARANNLLATVVQVIPGVNANVSRGGSLVMVHCNNANNAVEFLQVFDSPTASNITVGTTAPTLSIALPATTATGYALAASGIGFGTGIWVAATNTATGSTAPGTGLDCNFGYL